VNAPRGTVEGEEGGTSCPVDLEWWTVDRVRTGRIRGCVRETCLHARGGNKRK